MTEQSQTISPAAVFLAFLKLGLTSFGGPIAHIGYFRTEFVERRQWLDEETFAQLLATSQFLPGPASSQLGFSIGLIKAGWLGALSAFVAFTFPSVLLLLGFVALLPMLSGDIGQAVIHGLKLVACIIVADAVIGMARSLCPDWSRRLIALAALVALLLISTAFAQVIVIAAAAVMGALFLSQQSDANKQTAIALPYSTGLGCVLLILFAKLLIILPFLAMADINMTSIADAFYRAGALVFGGGHVVLPLLQDSVVTTGWVSDEDFLAGYGASQAIPGPMFAVSANLGALIPSDVSAITTAVVAVIFMFLPGFLLMAGILPFWRKMSANPTAAGVLAAVNAAVVGLLAAALYDPIYTAGVRGPYDLMMACLGLAVIQKWRLSPLWMVLYSVVISVVPVLLS
ncbi:MAG: chromate efflux transporter [Gammaproteobacteria bacterium]